MATGRRTMVRTVLTAGDFRHAVSTLLPAAPVAPKMSTFTASILMQRVPVSRRKSALAPSRRRRFGVSRRSLDNFRSSGSGKPDTTYGQQPRPTHDQRPMTNDQ